MMRICHIVSGDLWAGAACQVVNLLSELRKDDRFQLSAITFNPGRLTDELTALRIPVLCLPEQRQTSFRILLNLTHYLREHAIDVIHCHGHKEHILGCLAVTLAGRPLRIVRTLHGMLEPYRGLAGMKSIFYQKLHDFCCTFLTDNVIVVSHDMQRKLRERSWRGKIVCVHNGINPERVSVTVPREAMRASLGINTEAFVVGAACRLAPIKRLDLLLEIFSMVSRNEPRALLVICGDGPLERRLKEQAERLEIDEQVRFLGQRDDLYNVMSTFDLFVMTSEHEGIPMALLEALALGIPVVAPAVGGIPEIGEGDMIVLVDPPSIENFAQRISSQIKKVCNCPNGSTRALIPLPARLTSGKTAHIYERLRHA